MDEHKTIKGNSVSVTPPMLVNEITRLFHGRMRSFDLEGTMTQDSARQIMRHLACLDGCSQLELVRKTHLKAPTVSVTLRRLEDEGMVERRTDELDMRVTRVFLTEQGRAHNMRIWERLRSIDRELMQGFSEEETAQLLKYLERMRDNILPAYTKDNSQNRA